MLFMSQSREELIEKIKQLEIELKKVKSYKKYWLVWEDKPEIFEEKSRNALPILKEDKNLRIEENEKKPNNIIIEWDNYHSLSSLLYTHKGKVQVIYIDPPYNTWNKDFIYNDNYVDKEDSYRHSKWLSFMNKRLKLAKDLLTEDGIIFISIDDNEFVQLKMLCDKIFWENNFVDCISWDKKSSAKWVPPVNMIVNTHEYILTYQKSNKFSFIWENRDIKWFSNPDNDRRWPWRNTNIKSTVKKKDESFEIIDPETWNSFIDTWAFSENEIERLINEKYLIFPKNKNWQVRRKEFYNEFKNQNTPIKSSWWLFDNQKNTEMLKSMFWWMVFQNPKPIKLLNYLLKVVSKQNSTILDFFAWSWTTGHAVMELNKEDWWNRKFILCSNKENTKENPDKNICRNITYERNKKVIKWYKNSKWEKIEWLGWNLRYYTTEFIKADKSIDDLRYSFIDMCDDLLCIKENTFNEVKLKNSVPELRLFKKWDKYTTILYDIHHFKSLLNLLEVLDWKISVYIFSLSKDIFEEELEHFKNVTIQNIPDDILSTYNKIFNF